MADVFTKAKRSEVMSRIRGRGNKDTELALAALLRAHRISGWRRQLEVKGRQVEGGGKRRSGDSADRRHSRIPGASLRRSAESPLRSHGFRVRPDFVFPKRKVAVFVDGCFWHGCPKHATRPASRAAWWRKKILGNQARDTLVMRTLRRAGWRVLCVWEHELARKHQARLLGRIERLLKQV